MEVQAKDVYKRQKVSGATLVSEQGGKKSRFYKESAKVTQGKTINIGNKTYRVYLMKGAGDNPTDSLSLIHI